jgi:hypothetical protein
VLHYTRLEMLVRDKHSNLLDPFVSCAKKWSVMNTQPDFDCSYDSERYAANWCINNDPRVIGKQDTGLNKTLTSIGSAVVEKSAHNPE